jgi:thymidylate kinase
MPEQEEIGQLVTAVFRAWERAQVNFLVLRNYEGLPSFTTNDIDVLVAPEQVRHAEQTLFAAAQEAGFRLHNRAEYASLALYLSSKQSNAQAQFDLFTALKWRGFDFLNCREFLGRKVPRGLFAIPHPADEAATNLLDFVIYAGKVKPKYMLSIAARFRAEPALATGLLAGTYGPAHAKFLVASGAQEQWAAIEAATGALRRALILRQLTRHPWRAIRSWLTDAARLARRFLRPPGLTVVLCGADGCGKSTAASAVVDGLRGTFSPLKGRHFHWKPPLFSAKRRTGRGPVSDPHGQPARSAVVSFCYFLFHWLEFFLGSHLRLRPVTFRGGLVLIDRFYYDFFVDQRRYRLQVPPAVVRLGYALLKKPDLVLLLDAPAEVLQRRKQEVPLAETDRQCRAYRALVEGLSNGRVINAAQPVEKVAADINRTILDFMAQRMRQRQGKEAGPASPSAAPGRTAL